MRIKTGKEEKGMEENFVNPYAGSGKYSWDNEFKEIHTRDT